MSRVCRSSAFLFILLIWMLPPVIVKGDEGEKAHLDIKVKEISANVSPKIELSLPGGSIYEHFVENFNYLEMTFNLNYNFLDNSIGGDVSFAYPYKWLKPGLTFSDAVDFENYFAPKILGNDVYILPTDKYISRERGIELSTRFDILSNMHLTTAFLVSDIFKGDLSENNILDEGTDLIQKLSVEYNTIQPKGKVRRLAFEGLYASSVFTSRFRNRFSNPVSIDSENKLLFHSEILSPWSIEEKASVNIPVKIWMKEIVGFYTLGGFDSIRGYADNSINSFRFLLISNNLKRNIFPDKEVKFKLSKLRVYLHQFTLFFLLDELLTQDRLSIHAPLESYTSIGSGVSFVMSGKGRGHFHTELYLAQPLKNKLPPVIYFKTSLFSFEKKM